jgi:predicted DNA-binding transcriptional regulator AlpA
MIYLSDRDLAARWNVNRTTPWEWAKSKPDFPQPIKLSQRCTRWRLAEIEAWEQKAEAEVSV